MLRRMDQRKRHIFINILDFTIYYMVEASQILLSYILFTFYLGFDILFDERKFIRRKNFGRITLRTSLVVR